MNKYRIIKIPGETKEDTYYTIQKRKAITTQQIIQGFLWKTTKITKHHTIWEDVVKTVETAYGLKINIVEIMEYKKVNEAINEIYRLEQENV